MEYPKETEALKNKHKFCHYYNDLLRLCKDQTLLLVKLENERDALAIRHDLLTVAAKKISRITSPSPGIKPSDDERKIGSIVWNLQCDLGQF